MDEVSVFWIEAVGGDVVHNDAIYHRVLEFELVGNSAGPTRVASR